MDDDVTALALAAAADPQDRVVVGAFVRRTQADVWRLCALLAGRDRADDLTQEVYLRVLRGISGFRGDTGARPWLYTVVRSVVVDDGRRRARRPALPTRPARRSLEVVASDPAEEVGARGLVSDLERDRREAFTLTQQLGLSYAEAAVALDIPIGTVRSRVARARADLVEAWHADARPARRAGHSSSS